MLSFNGICFNEGSVSSVVGNTLQNRIYVAVVSYVF